MIGKLVLLIFQCPYRLPGYMTWVASDQC